MGAAASAEAGAATLRATDAELRAAVASLPAEVRDRASNALAPAVTPAVTTNASLDALADKLMAAAAQAEPSVTAFLSSVATEFGGEMDGLGYKFKSKISMLRKAKTILDGIARRKLEEGDVSDDANPAAVIRAMWDVIWAMWDSLRYTMILPTATYTEGVKRTMCGLEEQGVKPYWLSNCWPAGDGYQGINDTFTTQCSLVPMSAKTPGALQFELQFHTHESFAFKMRSHELYEVYRCAKDPGAKRAAYAEQARLAAQIPVPDGVLDIPTPSSWPLPCERAMFADLALSRAMAIERAAKEEAVAACVGSVEVDSILLAPSQIERCLERLTDATCDQTPLLLRDVVSRLPNVLTIVLVVARDGYATTTSAAVEKLRNSEKVTVLAVADEWYSGAKGERQLPRWSYSAGLYLRCSIAGDDDGVEYTDDNAVEFTVVLHTAQSHAAAKELQRMWPSLDNDGSDAAIRAYRAKRAELESAIDKP